MKTHSRERLEDLPGVGPAIARDLRRLGIEVPSDLLDVTPEELYDRLQHLDGPTDRCVLYTFRGARYFVVSDDGAIDPELLKWWHWKD